MQGTTGGAGRKAAVAAICAFCAMALFASSARGAAPLIEDSGVIEVGTTSAVFVAKINPQNALTRYRFEYGPEDCSVSVDPCTKVPVIEAQIPAGSRPSTSRSRSRVSTRRRSTTSGWWRKTRR